MFNQNSYFVPVETGGYFAPVIASKKPALPTVSEETLAIYEDWIARLEGIAIDLQNDQARPMILDDLFELRHEMVEAKDNLNALLINN
jgi:hypothetical protein